jgi:hydroxymethylglutaryl-CoA synthase
VTCYLEALEGAYRAYVAHAGGDHRASGPFSDRFAAIAYHVPYGKMAVKAHRHLRAIDGDVDATASFERQVAPGLVLPKQVGNIYTGSLYLSLASALSETKEDLEGRTVALFSYGSGSCAELFSGTVVKGAQAFARASGWRDVLAAQQTIDVAEYEEIMTAREGIDLRPATEDGGARDRARYLGVREHRRIYV